MSDFGIIPARWSPQLRSALRIMAAFGYMSHGTQKLFVFPSEGQGQAVQLLSIYGLAGVIETVCGGLLLVGFLSRPAAFLAAGEMAVAYFWAHLPHSFWPILNHGELALVYCFTWLFIAASGPGPWSVDALRGNPGG
jgi:putative oxidoreductase